MQHATDHACLLVDTYIRAADSDIEEQAMRHCMWLRTVAEVSECGGGAATDADSNGAEIETGCIPALDMPSDQTASSAC